MKTKTKEEWEEIGFLSNIPEDRKDKVVNAMNIMVDAMIQNIVHVGIVKNETIPVPIIVKIISAVDVADEDIPRLYSEILTEYNNHDFEKDRADCDYIAMDYQAMFLSKFADFKIEQYKNK